MPPGAAPFTWIFIAAQAAQPAARPALTIADQGYFFVAGQYTDAKKNNLEIAALLRALDRKDRALTARYCRQPS